MRFAKLIVVLSIFEKVKPTDRQSISSDEDPKLLILQMQNGSRHLKSCGNCRDSKAEARRNAIREGVENNLFPL
jgi:hypothetical protein